MTRVVRGVGWLLVVAGAVVGLYVVYLVWFTGFETAQGQASLKEQFEAAEVTPSDLTARPAVGDAYAVIWFERDGEMILTDEVLYVVEGTSLPDLRLGPGHYVDSPAPGEEGNVGIAGHRTTYGAPFGELAELQEGDTIHVLDRAGDEWVYAYVEQRIVHPTDVWVVEEQDPLDLDAPMITLTTCHPRFSAAQRLIAWGELIGEPKPSGDDEGSIQAAEDREAPVEGSVDVLPGDG
ncbi:class E sortase [Nitriliruptoraceae bacterium ZYF776]|nr:class E sortase [Profundirhabdus halotolerans]